MLQIPHVTSGYISWFSGFHIRQTTNIMLLFKVSVDLKWTFAISPNLVPIPTLLLHDLRSESMPLSWHDDDRVKYE